MILATIITVACVLNGHYAAAAIVLVLFVARELATAWMPATFLVAASTIVWCIAAAASFLPLNAAGTPFANGVTLLILLAVGIAYGGQAVLMAGYILVAGLPRKVLAHR